MLDLRNKKKDKETNLTEEKLRTIILKDFRKNLTFWGSVGRFDGLIVQVYYFEFFFKVFIRDTYSLATVTEVNICWCHE